LNDDEVNHEKAQEPENPPEGTSIGDPKARIRDRIGIRSILGFNASFHRVSV
jgi:hypothetical protein